MRNLKNHIIEFRYRDKENDLKHMIMAFGKG